MVRFLFLVVMLLAMGAAPTWAASCYSAYEAEAEQGLRIHSELMVIGLNCQHMTPKGEKNYYYQYKEFTARHGRLIAGYDDAMLGYFRRIGTKDPEGALNRLRTQFANKISGDAAKMRPDLFCTHYAPRIPKAGQMSDAQLRQWAGTFFDAHPVSQPICASAQVTVKR